MKKKSLWTKSKLLQVKVRIIEVEIHSRVSFLNTFVGIKL